MSSSATATATGGDTVELTELEHVDDAPTTPTPTPTPTPDADVENPKQPPPKAGSLFLHSTATRIDLGDSTLHPRPSDGDGGSGGGGGGGDETVVDIHSLLPPVAVPLHLRWDFSYTLTFRPQSNSTIPLRDTLMPQKKRTRRILHACRGSVAPGELLCIMGPSGCGKTTLLNILSGSVTTGVDGRYLVNGRPVTKFPSFKRHKAFVTQDDILFDQLTVRDTLYYTAALKMGSADYSQAERNERVQQIISELNLHRAADTIVGNEWMRGVSGGERKRLSIGNELVKNPSMIMLDEPTSGLDSSTALSLILTLRKLARDGRRTIITTIHQPSSEIFEAFDKLLYLADGHIVYSGPACDMVGYFSSLRFQCPIHYNPADYVMALILDEDLKKATPMRTKLIEAWRDYDERRLRQRTQQQQSQSLVNVENNINSNNVDNNNNNKNKNNKNNNNNSSSSSSSSNNNNSHDHNRNNNNKTTSSKRTATGHIKTDPASTTTSMHVDDASGSNSNSNSNSSSSSSSSSGGGSPRDNSVSSDDGLLIDGVSRIDIEAAADAEILRDVEAATAVKTAKYPTSWFEQTRLLLSRSIRQNRKKLEITSFVQVTVTSLVTGFLWLRLPRDVDNVDARIGVLFFSSMYLGGLFAMFMALFAFPPEKAVLRKERSAGTYRLSAYFVAKWLTELPYDMLYPILFTLIVYFLIGLKLDDGAFFVFLGILLLSNQAMAGLGLLISSLFMNVADATRVAATMGMSLLLASGFYIPVHDLPSWIRWLSYLSPVRYTFDALFQNEFSGTTFADPASPSGEKSGDAIIAERQVDIPVWASALALLAFCFGLRLMTYAIMRFRD